MSRASLLDWVRTGFTNRRAWNSGAEKRRGVARRRRTFPIELEAMEGRMLLATIVVNDVGGGQAQDTNATVAEMLKNPEWTITLRDAINIANNSPSLGGNIIQLQQNEIYQLRQVATHWYGPDGLPAVYSNITIQGNGSTIERASGKPFRFFYVSNANYGKLPTGTLTLNNLTLNNGYAKGGDAYKGGAGLGAGGAIFNQGTLVLNGDTLENNTEAGGDTAYYSSVGKSVNFGGGIGENASNDKPGGFGGQLSGPSNIVIHFEYGGLTREGQGGNRVDHAGFGGGGAFTTVGGFGGGGGVNPHTHQGGYGGFGGGNGSYYYGGAGGGMGGAVFTRGGSVTFTNSNVMNNHADGGDAYYYGNDGAAYGGAIFNYEGVVSFYGSNGDTESGNTLTTYDGYNNVALGEFYAALDSNGKFYSSN